MDKKQNVHAHYHYLEEDDIHHIIYQDVSRKAVDEFMVLFDKMLKTTPFDGTIKIIVDNDTNDQPQPLSYVTKQLREKLGEYPNRAAIRVVIVYENQNQLFAFIDMMVTMFARGRDRLRYFKRDDWDEMLDWLRDPEAK